MSYLLLDGSVLFGAALEPAGCKPLRNLEDMSPRAVRILREAKLITAESTRHIGTLLKHFEIQHTNSL
jgi:16S rRNA C1402 (ribose-2'-O) methylase RsmI